MREFDGGEGVEEGFKKQVKTYHGFKGNNEWVMNSCYETIQDSDILIGKYLLLSFVSFGLSKIVSNKPKSRGRWT